MWAAVGAVLLFTVMNVFAKYLSENHSVIEISFYRNVVASLPFLVAIVFFGRREILIIQSKPGAVIGRAALGVVSLALMFFAFALMPMAETTACLTLSLLNDAGYMAFCESDFVVIPAGILLANISDRPVFLNDPNYPHDGIITLANCTAPRRMDG